MPPHANASPNGPVPADRLPAATRCCESLAEALGAAVYELDVASGAWISISGLERLASGVATAVAWAERIHPDDVPAYQSALRGGPLSRETSLRREYRFAHPDGTWHLCLDRASPVRDDTGRVVRLVGCLEDVTAARRGEEARREADRRKDDFLAILAHELRNPLASLRNALTILQLGTGDSRASEEAMQLMERQLQHLVRHVDELLDVSRVARGKLQLQLESVELAEVVHDAVEAARVLIDGNEHQLTLALPPGSVRVHGDRTRLTQIVSNLLTNAAKYTPPRGQLHLHLSREEGQAVIRVRDNGAGIPCEALDGIFELFSQVDRSLERTSGGLGIGLSVVHGLVQMHGGSIQAESAGQGLGSTFTVRLPLTAAAPTTEAPPRAAEVPARGPRRRVLLVDDNQDAADSLAMLLEMMGHEVHLATDGVEGVAAAARLRPELILMDVNMPRLNGLEATRRIRAEPWGRTVTIIALTGRAQEADRGQTEEAGCNGHLLKPVGIAELQPVLELASDRTGQ